MNKNNIAIIVNSICNNEARVSRLRASKSRVEIIRKVKSITIGEARSKRIHLSEEEITECAYQIFDFIIKNRRKD